MRLARRGMTLLEMMITLVVASVVIIAATQAVIVVTQARRTNERRIEVLDNANTALTIIEFDATNAGYRFASPVFSTRVLDNVTGAEPELKVGGANITATANCGDPAWGIAVGSDTLELRYGWTDRVPAFESNVNCAGGHCDLRLGRAGGAEPNPFSDPGDFASADHVMLVTNADGTLACAGKINATDPFGTYLGMSMLDLDLESSADTSKFPACSGSTDKVTIMRLARRVRYLVCAPPATLPDMRPRLYRQTAVEAGPWGGLELVQEGVEDLQVAPRFNNALGTLSGGTPCNTTMCVCNEATSCTGYDPAVSVINAASGTPEETAPFKLMGYDVGVTGISLRTLAGRGQVQALEQYWRPALFNHPADATPVKTADPRRSRQKSVDLTNLTMVHP